MIPEPTERAHDALFPPEAIRVAVISGTGDGRMPQHVDGAVAPTPGTANPNLVVQVVRPIVALAVRFAYQFLTTLVGLVSAGMTPLGGDVIPANDFLDLVVKCAMLSVAGAGIGFLKDCLTIFSRLEGKFPLMSGSV